MSLLLIDEAEIVLVNSTPAATGVHCHSDPHAARNNQKQQMAFQENAANLTRANDHGERNAMANDQTLLMPIHAGYCLMLYLGGRSPMRVRIVTPRGCFLKVGNTRSVPQFCLQVAQVVGQLNLGLVAVPVNTTTGEIVLQMPFLISGSEEERARMQTFYRGYLPHCLPLVEYLVRETAIHGSTTHQNPSKVRTLDNVSRYSIMMHVSSHLNESRLEMEQDVLEKDKRRREDIRSVCQRRVALEESFKVSGALFECSTGVSAPLAPLAERDFELQHEEMRFIRWMLAMPVQYKPKNPFENLMVLNHIYVQDIDDLKLNRINAGGFSTIYLTEMRYLYVYSSEDHEILHPPQATPSVQGTSKLLHKYVVVKKEQGGGRVRSLRELEVLMKIKNGSSIFLPKYYIVTNRANPHADAVFMDFIPSRNLKEYLHLSATSISLLTKLYLAFSVAQALRYIRDYRIVHLDLKPNNIMVYCNMLVKLIDFGQAYHPELPPHKPGYTVPYSPPEIYSKAAAYSTKSDVYSFGVLLFEMIYETYPYDIFQSTRQVPLAMQDHLRRWLFVPEESQTYGVGSVMRILNGIISRCMASSPQERPELDWVALLVKHCFELLQ